MPPQRGDKSRGRKPTPTTPKQKTPDIEPLAIFMNQILSPSRSGGLGKESRLLDPKNQELYRAGIQGKLDKYWRNYPLRFGGYTGNQNAASIRHRKDIEKNILILLRPLREGVSSVKRRDDFALEVHETSLHLSILFKDPENIMGTFSRLFPDFYIISRDPIRNMPPNSPPSQSSSSNTVAPTTDRPHAGIASSHNELRHGALASTVLFLLHILVISYPAQTPFYMRLRDLHPALQKVLRSPLGSIKHTQSTLSESHTDVDTNMEGCDPDESSPSSHQPDSPPAYDWLRALTRCLYTHDYSKLGALTHRAAFRAYAVPTPAALAGLQPRHIVEEVMATLVDELRDKARKTAWTILRKAYRDVALRVVPAGHADSTGEWLAHMLALPQCAGAGTDSEDAAGNNGDGDHRRRDAEVWLERRPVEEVRRKDGGSVDGWAFVRVRP